MLKLSSKDKWVVSQTCMQGDQRTQINPRIKAATYGIQQIVLYAKHGKPYIYCLEDQPNKE